MTARKESSSKELFLCFSGSSPENEMREARTPLRGHTLVCMLAVPFGAPLSAVYRAGARCNTQLPNLSATFGN